MTSIERAKRFIQGKGRTLAMSLVPLATLAAVSVPAHAGTIGPAVTAGLTFNTTGCGVSVSGGTGSGSCTVSQLNPQNGVTGITLDGTGSVTYTSGGADGFLSLDFFASGSANGGTFGPGSIPLQYDFNVTDTDGNAVDYRLDLEFVTSLGDVSKIFSGSTNGMVSGTAVANIIAPVQVTAYSIELSVTDNDVPTGNDTQTTLSVDIPAGESVDINANTPSSTPEPATLSLVGSAIAGLMFWRRRSKA